MILCLIKDAVIVSSLVVNIESNLTLFMNGIPTDLYTITVHVKLERSNLYNIIFIQSYCRSGISHGLTRTLKWCLTEVDNNVN